MFDHARGGDNDHLSGVVALVAAGFVFTRDAPARHIGAFTRRQEHDAYRKALERLLRDLKVEASPASGG